MKRRFFNDFKDFWALFFLLCFSHNLFADEPENLPICVAPDGQFLPGAITDGAGGTIIVWEDYRTSADWDIYAQRVDASGVPLWDANGVAICREKNNQRYLRLAQRTDGTIVVWTDRRAGTNWDVYAQAIDRSGRLLWSAEGMPVCTNPAEQSTIAVLSDGTGGAIVAWEDERRSSEFQDLYMQRLDANGQPVWAVDGIPVFTSDSFQSNSNLISDDAGGFYVVWWDVVGTDQWHIMAHHLDMNGTPLWKAPIAVSPEKGVQGEPRSVSDGQGGIIVVWQIYDNFINDDLYAQRIDRAGKKQWGESGIPICAAQGVQKSASVVSDGQGGIVAVWQDERDVYADLYAQRIGADGKPRWRENGIPICVAGGLQDAPFLAPCGDNEFFAAWLDYREDYGQESNDAIYGQKISSEGKNLWAENGIPICTAAKEKQPPYVVSSDSGAILIVWSDARQDLGDIYMYRVK